MMEEMDDLTKQQCKLPVKITIQVIEAVGVLGTLQLALRHPVFKQRPTAAFIKEFAAALEAEIVSKAPKLKFICEAGWHERFDR